MDTNTLPLISVVIPARNASKYLKEAIESVQRQHVNAAIEIIVVDDGSVDNTGTIAEELGCRVIRIPASSAIKARNIGLKNATGDFILFHDADDVLRENSLSVLLQELIEDNQLQVVFALRKDFLSPDLTEEEKKTTQLKPGAYFGAIAGCALIRREIFNLTGGFDESLQVTGDAMAWQIILKNLAVKTKRVQYVAVNRRLHNRNMGKTNQAQEYKDYIQVLMKKVSLLTICIWASFGMMTAQTDSTNISLEEIVVVAYGTAKKSSITGSATQIPGEELTQKNQTELTKALAGEVPGLQVINTTGQPGSSATIRIRGFGSANSSRDPLYVLDGVPYDGDISAITSVDVESVTVLKDASASALYGARAANGVILITTKKGSKGKSTIEVDVKKGINMRLIPLYDVIDSPERYSELAWEALRNYGILQNKLSPESAGIFASENVYNSTRGISPGYNMWNTDANKVVDPVTGKISGAARKYTPEKWSDYLFRTGEKTEASVRFSGGADNLSYYTSFGALDEKGYYAGSDYSRLNARTNLDYQPRKWLEVTTNLSYAYADYNDVMQTSNETGFQFVNWIPPIYPVYKRDMNGNLIPDVKLGGYVYDFGDEPGYEGRFFPGINPVGTIYLDKDHHIAHQLSGNINFDLIFPMNFKFTSQNGYQYLIQTEEKLTNMYHGAAKDIGRIYRENRSIMGLTNTQILSYDKKNDGHAISAFAAHETDLSVFHNEQGEKYQLAKADNLEFSNAIGMQSLGGYRVDRKIESYFAQTKYNYDEKYFAEINFRRDGSSRFSKHKWGSFGSVGAAWTVSKEKFLNAFPVINYLRLKSSYGVFGNENFNLGDVRANYYPTQDLYDIRNLNGDASFLQIYTGNPDLVWEKSRMLNMGVDFSLGNNRLAGEIEFFQKRTMDMIFNKQTPSSFGITSIPVNDAVMENTGVEFSFSYKMVRTSDWNVAFRINGVHYTNRIINMPVEGDKEKALEIHGLSNIQILGNGFGWSRGHSIYDYYMREYAGVNPETGQSQWFVYLDDNNLNNAGEPVRVANMITYREERETAGKPVSLRKETTLRYADATLNYIGKSGIPDLTGSLGLDINYKAITFNVQFIYSIGGYGYDFVYSQLMRSDIGFYNWHKDIENHWTSSNQQTSVPRLTTNYDADVTSLSSRFLTSMSYLSLNNIRVGYTLPQKWMNKIAFRKCTLWVNGTNLFVLTSRKGYYANGSEYGESGEKQHIPMSTLTGGISVQF
jgi:TonB-linked SusC/RagA family outer membrane protein